MRAGPTDPSAQTSWSKRSIPISSGRCASSQGTEGRRISAPPLLVTALCLLPLVDRHRNSGDLQFDREQRAAAGEEQRLPVVASKADVRCRRMTVHDAAELVALRIEDVDAARAAAIDVAGDVDLHAVGPARLAAAQIGEDAVGLLREKAVGQEIDGADEAAAEIGNIENALVGRERNAVGKNQIIKQQRHGAEIAGHAVDSGVRKVPLL